MWIVYQKKDRTVVGMSALTERDLDKAAAIDEVVRGLLNAGPVKNYDAVQVTDVAAAFQIISAPLHHVAVTENSKGRMHVAIEAPLMCALLLRSDAPDVHPVDAIPEIKADGASFTTITVQKVTERGEPQRSRNDNDELYLRTTAGTLRSADGKEEIVSLRLKQGQAAFRLVSEKARRVATVTVFNVDHQLHDGSIRIEFI
jgi:hypothetical protein